MAPGQQRTPSRASSYSSIGTPESQNAALLGASAAFSRPKPKARASSNSYAATNEALAAATFTGTGNKTPSPKHGLRKSPSPAAMAPSSPPGSIKSTEGSGRKGMPTLNMMAKPNLTVPKQAQRERSKSPSHHAAQLAAARSPEAGRPRASTVLRPAVALKPRRLSEHHEKGTEKLTDSSPIPPTTSLVDLFERKSSNPATSSRRPEPIVIKPSQDLAIRSPKPVRVSDGGITSMFQMELDRRNGIANLSPTTAAKAHEQEVQYDGQSSSDDYVSASEDTAATSSPLTIRKRDSRTPSVSTVESSSLTSNAERRLRPSPSPLRHSSTQSIQIRLPPPRSITSPPATLSASSQSGPSIAAQFHQLYPRRVTPLNTGDELANAIVASSLASSRAPSPRKMEPPPVPTRRQKHHKLTFSRTPSPTKHGMRQTLRKADSSDSESEDELHPYGKHKKKRLVRKHPNKHHEGDRKRWRDAITERERKRYEGVWAANKGMHYSFTPEEERQASEAESSRITRGAVTDQVSSIVARDIWNRSRLPEAVLETVWDLVDNDCVGRLNKEQFVVGMWLIDQRLKGRKLPVKVSDTVWASVRGLSGIKIRKK